MSFKQWIYAYVTAAKDVVASCGMLVLPRFLSDYVRIRGLVKERISAVIAEHSIDAPGVGYQKYLDADFWVLESVRRAFVLGLPFRGKKIRLLDIGTGAAYFPFVCKFYGHFAEGLDVPDNEMYNKLISALGITRHTEYVRAFQPLNLKERYDLITAYMICFNCHKQPGLWHIREWEYFLSSLKACNLTPEGEAFFSFNAETLKEPVSSELLAYFAGRRAKVTPTSVHIGSDYDYEAQPKHMQEAAAT